MVRKMSQLLLVTTAAATSSLAIIADMAPRVIPKAKASYHILSSCAFSWSSMPHQPAGSFHERHYLDNRRRSGTCMEVMMHPVNRKRWHGFNPFTRLFATSTSNDISTHNHPAPSYLIHWRGEHKEQYSQSFRQWEFLSALSATVAEKCGDDGLNAPDLLRSLKDQAIFTNAFSYDPYKRNDQLPPSVPLCQVDMYNEALQYLQIVTSSGSDSGLASAEITTEHIVRATERCSLIHSTYLVLAEGSSYPELVYRSLHSEIFENMMQNNGDATWRVRRHEFNFVDDDNNPRFGKRKTRSVQKEREVLPHLERLLVQFRGKVDLKKPECDIYLLEGLSDDKSLDATATQEISELYKILARRLTAGASHSIMAPSTRICISNTPLCSIAAHLLCNIAMIQKDQTILDPFCGSAATLLAASLISPTVRTVGIDIASNESISRSTIKEDFVSRGVAAPVALLEGDVMDHATRDRVRAAIGNAAYDVIVTDPPYGRREAMSGGGVGDCAALNDLIDVIGYDRKHGIPLLKPGGQLVAFLPCPKDADVLDLLPSQERMSSAGLCLLNTGEQRLNEASRWIVSFVSHEKD